MPCPRFVVACFCRERDIYAAVDGFDVSGGSVRLLRGADLRRGVPCAGIDTEAQASERAASWVRFTGNDTGDIAGRNCKWN